MTRINNITIGPRKDADHLYALRSGPNPLREQIEADVAAYLARGGQISTAAISRPDLPSRREPWRRAGIHAIMTMTNLTRRQLDHRRKNDSTFPEPLIGRHGDLIWRIDDVAAWMQTTQAVRRGRKSRQERALDLGVSAAELRVAETVTGPWEESL